MDQIFTRLLNKIDNLTHLKEASSIKINNDRNKVELLEIKHNLSTILQNYTRFKRDKAELEKRVLYLKSTNKKLLDQSLQLDNLIQHKSNNFTEKFATKKEEKCENSTKRIKTQNKIPKVNDSQLSKIPKYMLGRLEKEKINNFIKELNNLFEQKYSILSNNYKLQTTKMTKSEQNIYNRHVEAINEECKEQN